MHISIHGKNIHGNASVIILDRVFRNLLQQICLGRLLRLLFPAGIFLFLRSCLFCPGSSSALLCRVLNPVFHGAAFSGRSRLLILFVLFLL